MSKIIIAGDSWGAHSYEKEYLYPDLQGFKFSPKKNYVLYPGPGYFLQQHTDKEVITIADHGVSNREAFDTLNKIDHSNDIVIFYQTGILRDLSRAYTAKKVFHTEQDCEKDYEYYANKFYEQCSKVECKHFALIGGCAKVDITKSNSINVIKPSITEWLYPEFTDTIYDNTHYWLEFIEPKIYNDDTFYKQGVIRSGEKIDFWKTHDDFFKAHPTVSTNKKIAKMIKDYLTDKTIL